MRPICLAVALAAVGAATACGSDPRLSQQSGAGEIAADCTTMVQYGGTTYTEIGYVEQVDHQVGQATLGECDDQGPEYGITFPSDAKRVEAWTIDDVSEANVIARPSRGSWQVFVSEELPQQDRQHIAKKLGFAN